MKIDKIYLAVKILSFVGVLLALYLLWQQFSRPDFQPCYINSLINCDAVITGKVAKTFGIPTPLYGLIGYVMILVATVMRYKKVILYVSAFGLLFCLSIGYIEIVQLKVICPICITCQAIMIAIFLLSRKLNTLQITK